MMTRLEMEYWKAVTGGPLPSIKPDAFCSIYDKLIGEARHQEANIGRQAIGYLKSCLREDNPSLVDNNKLKDLIFDKWPSYNDFCIMCMNCKLWMLKCRLSKPARVNSILAKIDHSFNGYIAAASKDAKGLCVRLQDDVYVIVINADAEDDDQIIVHEFMHFVQQVAGKFMDEKPEKALVEVKKFFGIDDRFLNYVLDRHEFYVNVFNEIFNGLQKTYWTYFSKSYAWKDYVGEQMNEIKQNLFKYRDLILTRIWAADNEFMLNYLDVLACISYVDEDFFNDIVEKLKNK